MTCLLLSAALLAPAAPPGDWTFVDETTRDGRSLVTFRTVELSDTPTRPLDPADKPPAGSKFGSAGVGPGGRHRLGVVWHPVTNTLWFDADGNGRFSTAERHTLGDKPIEAKVNIPFGDGVKRERTVLIRKRGDGVAWAVRGYTTGTVTLRDKKVAAMLTDGDADGCFDSAGADRIWLDLDDDGKFDPLTEQFPLGTAVAAGGTALLIRPQPDGLGVEVRERPNESGTLRVEIVRRPKSDVADLSANYVSEFGELVVVKAADTPITLPAGKYRVDSLRLKVADEAGKVWHYTFATGDRSFGIDVTKGKETHHKLLDGLTVTVSFDAGAGVAPGGSVQVQADVAADQLYLTRCEVGEKFAEYGREMPAEIILTETGSVILDRCEAGFH
jgi:hypothetical protein